MAGHSKWANIKRRKEQQDAKKAKSYGKLLKEVAIAARLGSESPRLKMAIQNAKANSVPKENIERAIKKANVEKDNTYKEVQYEGYGPGGVAILVLAVTNNLNRTVSNVRALFNKNGGSLDKQGSIQYLFDHVAHFVINIPTDMNAKTIEELSLSWIEAGAKDIDIQGKEINILAPFTTFSTIQKILETQGLQIKEAQTTYSPYKWQMPSLEESLANQKLIDSLEEDDDVQSVHHNLTLR